MNKTLKRALIYTGLSLVIILVLALIGILVFWLAQPAIYSDYYDLATEEFAIAGLDDGVVPQGFCQIGSNEYAYCGFMSDGTSASRIYLMFSDGSNRYMELYTEDGKPYTGHTGGLAATNFHMYLANDGEGDDNCVWVFSIDELLNPHSNKIILKNKFQPECRAACVTTYRDMLWVGEFYDGENYLTKESHHLTAPDGTKNPSFICGYAIDESSPIGIAQNTPEAIVSAPEKLQGFAINDKGEWVLSTSYWLSSSNLQFYNNTILHGVDSTFTIDGKDIPVYFLDHSSKTKTIEAPPMSEELVYRDGRVYILYESASHKYVFGILTRGRYVYSYPF